MANLGEVESALDVLINAGTKRENITILHCTTNYPCPYEEVNLKAMLTLKEAFKLPVGYSDHTLGITIPIAAVSMGAKIIEKHITLDRRLKGTDHKGSLGIDGLNRMVRDIRNLEKAMGEKTIFTSDKVMSAKIKLERSIASNKIIRKGEIIHETDIHLLSPGDGFKYIMKDEVIGKIAIEDIPKNEIIYPSMIL